MVFGWFGAVRVGHAEAFGFQIGLVPVKGFSRRIF